MAGADDRASDSDRRSPSPSSPPPKRTRWDPDHASAYPSRRRSDLDHDRDAPVPLPLPPTDAPPYSPSEHGIPPRLRSPSPYPTKHTRRDDDDDDREQHKGCGGSPCSPPTPLPLDDVSYPPYEPTEREEQRRAYAEQAVRRHNKGKGNKVKYALVEVAAASWSFDGEYRRPDVHLNLYVRAKNGPKKHGSPELVVAELWKDKALTSWQVLGGGNEQFPGRYSQHRSYHGDPEAEDALLLRVQRGDRAPKGSLYKKGHSIGRDYHPD